MPDAVSMAPLDRVAPAFVEMAHRIVWCASATVDRAGRPRTRVLHPIWEWDGTQLRGWVATAPTPLKRAHLEKSPHLSLNYWDPSQDNCIAECRARWSFDLSERESLWARFKYAPAPIGYDPAIIDGWESAASEGFAVLELEPWRVRVFPGTLLLQGQGELLTWQEPSGA